MADNRETWTSAAAGHRQDIDYLLGQYKKIRLMEIGGGLVADAFKTDDDMMKMQKEALKLQIAKGRKDLGFSSEDALDRDPSAFYKGIKGALGEKIIKEAAGFSAPSWYPLSESAVKPSVLQVVFKTARAAGPSAAASVSTLLGGRYGKLARTFGRFAGW